MSEVEEFVTERFSIRRAILTGSVLCILLPVMAHLSVNLVHASSLASDFMPVGAIFLFFVLVLAVNTLARAIRPRWAMTRAELLVVYIMLIMGAAVTTMGLVMQLLPLIGAPFQYATPENRWAEWVLPHLPSWLVPDAEAGRGFYVGLAAGESIPWMAWVKPLAGWLIFLVPALFVMIALMVVMRKQWVEKEHLIFPLTALPIAMCEPAEEGRAVGPFFRNRGMWIGFAIALTVTSSVALHNYWDFIPAIELLTRLQVFRKTTQLVVALSFPVLGFAFLINKDLSFSLWFFNLLFLCVTGLCNMTGVRLDENLGAYGSAHWPILAYVGGGAFLAFVVAGLFNARAHLWGVVAKAFGRPGGEDDSAEIMSYRSAVCGIIISLAIMWGWLTVVGLKPWISPLYLLAAYILFLGLTRVVSEGGLPTIVAPIIAPTLVMSMIGVKALGAAGMLAFALMYVWSADIRVFTMAECAQGLKLAENCPKRSRRGILSAMAVALIISFAVSVGVALWVGYRYGGTGLNEWFFVQGPKVPFNFMVQKLQDPTGPSVPGYLLMGAGALVTVGLSVMRASFPGFILHPIGFAVGGVWLMNRLWFSVFLAWLIKSLVLRYGGARVYRKVVPFFLGLVLGTYTAAGLWFVVDLITGQTGNKVFWL